MSSAMTRLDKGGAIDRAAPLAFTFDSRICAGYRGDTLASALLANGVDIVGVSNRWRRPRGILSAGPEEPAAIVRIARETGGFEIRAATEVVLEDGLAAFSLGGDPVAAQPSQSFRARAAAWIRQRLGRPKAESPPLVAVPSAKTPVGDAKPRIQDARFAHCDVLIIGGGPAGLAAALSATSTGARIILAERSSELGGSLTGEKIEIDSSPASAWLTATLTKLKSQDDTILLTQAEAMSCFDGRLFTVRERLPASEGRRACERLWKIRPREIVLATGGIELPMIFADNDRPGVMLAGAVRRYIHRFAVRPGEQAVVFTNNDSAYRTALDLLDAGARVPAIVDARENPQGPLPLKAKERAIEIIGGSMVTHALGERRVAGVRIAGVDERAGRLLRGTREIECDLLCVSAGWRPSLALFEQAGGASVWNAAENAFWPGDAEPPVFVAGAAAGFKLTRECIESGLKAGRAAAEKAGAKVGPIPRIPSVAEKSEEPMRPLIRTPGLEQAVSDEPQWIDLAQDLTVSDVVGAIGDNARTMSAFAAQSGLGSGPDGGATSWTATASLIAALTNKPVEEVDARGGNRGPGRAPLAFLATSRALSELQPYRQLPAQKLHEELGARIDDVAGWRLPLCYPKPGESFEQTLQRETLAIKKHPLLCDLSARGKIEIRGADAAAFLDSLTSADILAMPSQCSRRGLVLDERGALLDECDFVRLAEDAFLVLTSTGLGKTIEHWLSEWRQCERSDSRVFVADVTAAWACLSLLGPLAEESLKRLEWRGDTPHLSELHRVRIAALGFWDAPVFRSEGPAGEAFTILAPASYAALVWQALLGGGSDMQATPIGFETYRCMTIEQGNAPSEAWAEERRPPCQLGKGSLLGDSASFVGKEPAEQHAFESASLLIGLRSEGLAALPVGAPLALADTRKMAGEILASCRSPIRGFPLALAAIAGDAAKPGDRISVYLPEGERTATAIALPIPTGAEENESDG